MGVSGAGVKRSELAAASPTPGSVTPRRKPGRRTASRTPSRGSAPAQAEFRELDLLDYAGLTQLFAEHKFDAVIHFAGLKVE